MIVLNGTKWDTINLLVILIFSRGSLVTHWNTIDIGINTYPGNWSIYIQMNGYIFVNETFVKIQLKWLSSMHALPVRSWHASLEPLGHPDETPNMSWQKPHSIRHQPNHRQYTVHQPLLSSSKHQRALPGSSLHPLIAWSVIVIVNPINPSGNISDKPLLHAHRHANYLVVYFENLTTVV